MNLEQMTIAVRERRIPELYDLALALCRRHAADLTVLALAGAAPFIVINWLLLGLWGGPEGWWPLWTWLLGVLLIAEVPLATAPLTAFLGEAMFNPQARKRDALRQAAQRGWALATIAVVRLGAALLPALLVLVPAHPVEVVLLERQGLWVSWRRAGAMVAQWRGEHCLHLVIAAVVLVGGVVLLAWSGIKLVSLLVWGLTYEEDVLPMLDPGASLLPHLLAWPLIAYLAVVRFLTYLDLRTRREGWGIELDLRRAGRRLDPAGEA